MEGGGACLGWACGGGGGLALEKSPCRVRGVGMAEPVILLEGQDCNRVPLPAL